MQSNTIKDLLKPGDENRRIPNFSHTNEPISGSPQIKQSNKYSLFLHIIPYYYSIVKGNILALAFIFSPGRRLLSSGREKSFNHIPDIPES
jgi:hypothetical protein